MVKIVEIKRSSGRTILNLAFVYTGTSMSGHVEPVLKVALSSPAMSGPKSPSKMSADVCSANVVVTMVASLN